MEDTEFFASSAGKCPQTPARQAANLLDYSRLTSKHSAHTPHPSRTPLPSRASKPTTALSPQSHGHGSACACS